MKEAVWDITDQSELQVVAKRVIDDCTNSNSDGAAVLALSGDLGAGKTTFVQTLARHLGVSEHVTSPTFVIMKRYSVPQGQRFNTLVHIDAYRVESPEELAILGLERELSDPQNLVCIEWAEKIPRLLPLSAAKLAFDLQGSKRTLSYTKQHGN
jgi:tRNA threonylcarbamoyladenosine biosynthesis protein TsaE